MDLNQTQQKKPEKKRLEKGIKGSAKINKQSKGSLIKDTLINDDFQEIRESLFIDYAAPKLKDFIVGLINMTAELLFYGRVKGGSSNSNASYVSYSSMGNKNRQQQTKQRPRRINELDSIEFENRGDAENVVDILNELIDTYGEASVSDLYDWIGERNTNGFVDDKFGWKTKLAYDITYSRGYWVLHLPRVVELD